MGDCRLTPCKWPVCACPAVNPDDAKFVAPSGEPTPTDAELLESLAQEYADDADNTRSLDPTDMGAQRHASQASETAARLRTIANRLRAGIADSEPTTRDAEELLTAFENAAVTVGGAYATSGPTTGQVKRLDTLRAAISQRLIRRLRPSGGGE